MKDEPIFRDERTLSVENASYRWGYLLLSFGLLLTVAVRSLVYQESNWDLMALVVIGGLVTTAYQVYHRTLTRRWLFWALITAGVAAAVGFVVLSIVK